jgi:outer membrane protein insertion porin family
VRINDRFFKGGNSFRGFETAGIGPRDLNFDDAAGGKVYAIGSIELSFPTFLAGRVRDRRSAVPGRRHARAIDDADKLTRRVRQSAQRRRPRRIARPNPPWSIR